MDEKILLVDDEKDIADLLEEVLIQDGFRNIRKACTGMDALAVCREFQPDVMILDIMLPDLDGLEVCRKIREFSYCSILFLSSKNDEIDKILGLSCGGDDYITKPFSPPGSGFPNQGSAAPAEICGRSLLQHRCSERGSSYH